MLAALAPFGLDTHAAPAPVTADDPLEARLAYMAAAETGFEQVFSGLMADLPAVPGVTRSTETIRGVDGNDVVLHIHRPERDGHGSLPGVLHLHGGGMTMLGATGAAYVRIRDELAAAGMVVVGVEFRNAAGGLGPHPFPAGLNDCASATRWVYANRTDLGISHVITCGESGGGNLALTTALTAKREGWLDEIAGVYAQCPFLSGRWYDLPDDLPSLRENDGYFLTREWMGLAASLYDPAGENSQDATCYAGWATDDDLRGLPPHTVSVNELDPLRDEGLLYYRRLVRAGVPAVGRIVAGTAHACDLLLGGYLPDVFAASMRDVHGFAHSLT
jgi:acetyl esterase/lipase